MDQRRILVINPGSTSTKIAVFAETEELFSIDLVHSQQELDSCASLADQLPMRKEAILKTLTEKGFAMSDFAAIACRGGTFGKADGGAYLVDEALLEACRHPRTNHPSNLAAIIGYELGNPLEIPAFIYDAVCTDEVWPLARRSGLKGMDRKPNSHVLNTRAVCRQYAEAQGKRYEDMSFVCAHIGGGISLNLHQGGRIVDVLSDDEGPMSPERAGRLNAMKLVKLCFSGKYTEAQVSRMLKGDGGLRSHLGTSDVREAERMVQEGNAEAEIVLQTMAYQIAKGIGELAAAASGKVDSILLTGGAARSKYLTDQIRDRVSFIAPVQVVPGAMEMEALDKGILRVLSGEETAKYYQGRKK